MKVIVALAALIAIAVAAPANPDADATVLEQHADIHPDGHFNHLLKTSNGIGTQVKGVVVPNPSPKSAEDAATFIAITGEYSYTAPDGQLITVKYVADENGFRAEGAHLPVGPVLTVV